MSENYDEKIIDNLEKLGLTRKEAIVYIDLLKRDGAVGSSKIVRNTGLHGQYVYDALYSLEEKGLARHDIVSGRKRFSANATSNISRLLEEKKRAAEISIAALDQIAKRPIEQNYEVYQEENAYIKRQLDSIEQTPEGGEILIISTLWGNLFTKSRPDFFVEFERLRKRKNISVRFILNESLREQATISKRDRFKTDIRFIPEYLSHGGFGIYQEHVDFYFFGKPLVLFSFNNKLVAEGYRNFFEVLWKMGSM